MRVKDNKIRLYKKGEAVRNVNGGFYFATGIVQRRDVSIFYSVILHMFTQYNYEGYNLL